MKIKIKRHTPLFLIILAMIILINAGCTVTVVDNSTASVVTRDIAPQSNNISVTPINSVDKNEEVLNTPTITPTPLTVSVIGGDENEEALAVPTITPSPVAVTIDIDSFEWKVAIPHVTDSCQFTIADSSDYSFVLSGETPSGNPIICLATWNSDGQQLAITSKDGIEIVDLNSKERTFFENPFLAQITGEEYSLLNVAYNSWSKNSNWLEVLARNRLEASPLEQYQTIVFDTSSKEPLIFEESLNFKTWSPINENAFAYITLESGGGNIPGVYNVGIWDVTLSQSITVVEGLSDQYNIYNSQLILSPDGKYAVLDVIEKDTAANIILLVDFQQGIWKVLSEEANLVPWSWSSSGNWIGFYNSNGLYFLNDWTNGSPTITSLNIGGAIPIGWLPSKDIFVYEHNQKIYVFDPNRKTSRTLLLDLTDIDADIGQYTPIVFWVNRIDN